MHPVAQFYRHYNFYRVHQTLRVTPAMQAVSKRLVNRSPLGVTAREPELRWISGLGGSSERLPVMWKQLLDAVDRMRHNPR
jgi:hypothetical protein